MIRRLEGVERRLAERRQVTNDGLEAEMGNGQYKIIASSRTRQSPHYFKVPSHTNYSSELWSRGLFVQSQDTDLDLQFAKFDVTRGHTPYSVVSEIRPHYGGGTTKWI